MGATSTAIRNTQRNRPTLRELEVFRSVIRCGKTTAAARQLGISQPAVSRALAQLEARKGEMLFRRDGNRLVPTAEALALDRELEPMFEVLARLLLPSGSGNQGLDCFSAPISQHFVALRLLATTGA